MKEQEEDKTNKKLRLGLILISLTIFVFSLTQDAFIYDDFDGQKTHSSFALLLMGGLAILGGGLFEWLIWVANPIYIGAIIMFLNKKKVGMKLSILATLIGFSFLSWSEILAAENGRTATIYSLELGYWSWISSMTILNLGMTYYYLNQNKHEAQQ